MTVTPGRNAVIPVVAQRTGIAVLRPSSRGSVPGSVLPGRCCITSTGTGNDWGSPASTVEITGSPPRDATITTRSKRGCALPCPLTATPDRSRNVRQMT
jgi:hypothetical protein